MDSHAEELVSMKNILMYNDQPIITDRNKSELISFQYEYLEGYQLINFKELLTGSFYIKLPKSVPVVNQFDEYTGLNYLIYKIILADDEEIDSKAYDSECFLNYFISLNNTSVLELVSWYNMETEYSYLPIDFEPYCLEIFENPPPLKECKENNQNHINKRGESVCVNSVEKLIQRGYLV